jgi:hypothetical protein
LPTIKFIKSKVTKAIKAHDNEAEIAHEISNFWKRPLRLVVVVAVEAAVVCKDDDKRRKNPVSTEIPEKVFAL